MVLRVISSTLSLSSSLSLFSFFLSTPRNPFFPSSPLLPFSFHPLFCFLNFSLSFTSMCETLFPSFQFFSFSSHFLLFFFSLCLSPLFSAIFNTFSLSLYTPLLSISNLYSSVFSFFFSAHLPHSLISLLTLPFCLLPVSPLSSQIHFPLMPPFLLPLLQ